MKKVLIIEDDPCIRMLLTEVIEEAFDDSLDNGEFEVFEACDGEQGFQMAQQERPDLIFSDVMMPKMDGFEVCSKIKNDPDLRDIYFILLTAKGQEVDKKKGASVGCDEYMTKPFKPELIVAKVEEMLGLEKGD
ncbi:MAG: response regulator transcription factor [Candidatus Anammoxibacter sp.]